MLNFDTMDYLPEEFACLDVPNFVGNKKLRDFAFQRVDKKLPILMEFGVADGTTFNEFARMMKGKQLLYGYDGFQGFPTNWDWGDGVRNTPAGKFVGRYKTPHPSTKIVEGWFSDTLPNIQMTGRLGMIHIDCDVYESTREVFLHLDPYIEDGTVIIFDEISGYPNYEEHEWKALNEWRDATGKEIEWIALSLDTTENRPHELHGAAGIVRCPPDQLRGTYRLEHTSATDDAGDNGTGEAEERSTVASDVTGFDRYES